MKKAVIILPTYNESKNIKLAVESVFQVVEKIENWIIEVLVVDSNSPDNTAELVKDLQKKYKKLYLIETPKEGLGKAYINGFKYAIDQLKAYVVFEMDADLSHNPQDIPRFLEKIEKGADFVIGSRYIKGGSIPSNWAFHRKLFSIAGNWIIRLGFMKLSITDWSDGFRAIKAWIVKDSISYVQNYSGYVFQVALLDNALKLKANVKEIPVNFVDRTEGVSKMDSVQYILQTLWYVFTHSSFVKFVIVGVVGFGVDFGFAYFFIHGLDFSKPNANALSAEFAIISNFIFNNFWSFKHKQIEGGIFQYLKKLFFFNVVSSGSIAIQWIGMTIALMVFGDKTINLGFISIHSWIIYKIGIIAFIIIPYSYILYNKLIWKDK